MKQNKQMYEAPKVELIEMETQGVLCASALTGAGMNLGNIEGGDWNNNGAWVL